MKNHYYLFLLITLFASSCQDDLEPAFIEAELLPFIETFVLEGAKRGVDINIDNLDAFFVDDISENPESRVCGSGFYRLSGTDRNRILIENSERCWANMTDIEKENFVFHELGHAILDRRHLEDVLPNESPKTIMCSEICNIGSAFSTYHDNEDFRDYYLDELFGTDALPDFTNRTNFVETVYEEGPQPFYTDWELALRNDDANSANYAFTIDSTDWSLRLTSEGTAIEDSEAFIFRRFELNDFTNCANLKAFADITAEGFTDGEFGITLSLRERLSDGSLNRFYINSRDETESGFYDNYLHETYCIGDRTEIVTLSFTLSSTTPASLTIENLRVDLFE